MEVTNGKFPKTKSTHPCKGSLPVSVDFCHNIINLPISQLRGSFMAAFRLQGGCWHSQFQEEIHIRSPLNIFSDERKASSYPCPIGQRKVVFFPPRMSLKCSLTSLDTPFDREVRNLVTALSLFVPGYLNRARITPWRTKQVTLADLPRIKLAGVSKAFPIPKNVEVSSFVCFTLHFGVITTPSLKRYATILDLENETLKSPSYEKGVFIEQIMGRQKNWVGLSLLIIPFAPHSNKPLKG